jgi:hypothetical protein
MQCLNLNSFAQSAFSFCGFAASRAESLWLSVKLTTFGGYAAVRGEASRLVNGRTESRRLSAREAAKPLSIQKSHLDT